MAPPLLASLILRIVTFILVFISLIILVSSSEEIVGGTLRFNSFYALRYTLFTMVISVVYSLLQIAFTIYHMTTGKPLGGDGLLQFDFYGDKIILCAIATGVGAAFGVAVDSHESSIGFDTFFGKIYASCSLLLFGFVCAAISSVFSSYSLPK